MRKTLLAAAALVTLSGAVAVAADWPAFDKLDTNGNGVIDRIEYQKNVGALKIEYAPNFAAMDEDSNNGVDEDEWKAAQKLTTSYTARCREASASWCKDAK
ncbi:hypothetical protein [Chenggangzhangella methanolivorans]|uniref:EF-hand domain-containing protein n=1 Tax=Chenggangzhangella methanolivorans TaxID=1437009 RepID=A0A9E6R7T5_9HYPH|nr:hypothetical protein [Chenggangzhangella methanolivorans]QZN99036.1 hypothetical protein K6K41_19520 [Chenggangzhangella methanolivorans]